MKLIIFNETLIILNSFQFTVKTKLESNWGLMIR